jgi:uncharacterized RDD family membrane protein YckC
MDFIIITVLADLILFVVGDRKWWPISRGYVGRHGNLVAATVAAGIAALLYYPVLVWRTDGQTVGKMVLHIRVLRVTDRRMTVASAAMREVGLKFLAIQLLAVLPIVGFGLGEVVFLADGLWPLWDRENRALHDMLARTRVCDSR